MSLMCIGLWSGCFPLGATEYSPARKDSVSGSLPHLTRGFNDCVGHPACNMLKQAGGGRSTIARYTQSWAIDRIIDGMQLECFVTIFSHQYGIETGFLGFREIMVGYSVQKINICNVVY